MKKLIIALLALMLLFASGVLAAGLPTDYLNVSLTSPKEGMWNNTGVTDFTFVVKGNLSGKNYSCFLYHNISQDFGIDSIQENRSVLGGNATSFRKAGIPDNSVGWAWNVFCNSTKNNTLISNDTNFTFKVDTTIPVLSESSPAENSWDTDGVIVFNVNVTEANPDSCILNFNLNNTSGNFGEFNYSLNTQHYFDQTWVNFSLAAANATVYADDEGNYIWNVSCNDSAGNILQSPPITFYIDTIAPETNVTAPTNGSTSTDWTPNIHWLNVTNSTNFSHYAVLIDNDSDFNSPEYQENVTTATQNYTTVSTGLSGDVTYYINVTAYDLAGNKGKDRSGFLYSTDSTCHTLYLGWNICSIIRTTTINATDLCTEIGSTCSYIAKYNSSHDFQTYVRGASANGRMNFNANTTPDESAVVFIYVASETTYENRTWGVDATTFNFTFRNDSTGWNIFPVLNRSGIRFWQLDYSIQTNYTLGTFGNESIPPDKGYNSSTMNITRYMSYYNASADNYVPYRSNWTWYNDTFIDYGDAVWIHFNVSGGDMYYWNAHNRSKKQAV